MKFQFGMPDKVVSMRFFNPLYNFCRNNKLLTQDELSECKTLKEEVLLMLEKMGIDSEEKLRRGWVHLHPNYYQIKGLGKKGVEEILDLIK